MRSRLANADPPAVTIRPPFGERAKAAMARSIWGASRTLTGLTSIRSDGAAAWITANWLAPPTDAGSRRTAARVTPGAICLRSSSHFPAKLYSNVMKPVALPPGRGRLSDEAGADRIDDSREHDRHGAGRL